MPTLLSLEFLALSVGSTALLPLLRGALRQGLFLGVNLLFLHSVLGPPSLAALLGFCALAFALAMAIVRANLSRIAGVGLLVAVFAWMRSYDVVTLVLPHGAAPDWLVTVGLSFVLFRAIHVMFDIGGESFRPIDPITYLNYLLNFATFLMGPIQRYPDYYDQWHGRTLAIPLTLEAHLDAVVRILRGLVKVYILGAWLAGHALQPDTDVSELSLGQLALQLYAFYFFLYMNFSGYCDVVVGIGSLMGVRPPENFNMPFLATNMADFWLRQHRSLTLWLTDYVFTPAYKWALKTRRLGRHPLLAANLAILLTMLVSGLWHGTTIGFLIFGLLHGLYLVIFRCWTHVLSGRLGKARMKALSRSWPSRAAGAILTFNAAAFAFLFFQLDTPHLLQLIDRAWPL